MMNPGKEIRLKVLIQEKIEYLRSTLAKENEETKPIAPDVAIGRLSRLDSMQMQQMALAMERRQRAELEGLEAALLRIKKGTYGICETCRNEIAEARLQAIPDATLCINCAR
jgi:DnaK suppressor protein